MSVTTEKQLDITAAAVALRSYFEGINFIEGWLAPYQGWEANGTAVVNAMAGVPAGTDVQPVAASALRQSIDETGNGGHVTDAEVAAGAAQMVAAILKRRNP